MVHAAACRTHWNGASVEAGRPAGTALQDDRTSAVTSLAAKKGLAKDVLLVTTVRRNVHCRLRIRNLPF